jgi:hypothetical protein
MCTGETQVHLNWSPTDGKERTMAKKAKKAKAKKTKRKAKR